jgi:arylsulfatase A-like enzyme
MQRFKLLSSTLVWAAALLGSAAAIAKPVNVVMIVADDMGYADLGVTGCKDFATPNLDSIANSGVRFTQSYVTAAVCSPSRAGFMSGQYQQRFGHEHNGGGPDPFGVPTNVKLMPEHFKAAGYKTGMVGKWHLGESPGKTPLDRGFDSFVGMLGGGHAFDPPTDPTKNQILDGRQPAKWDTYLTTYLGERSVEFVRNNASEPFFLYIAFNAPHTPMQARESDMPALAHIEDGRRRKYASMMIAMDEAVGKVLAELKATGVDQNTMIVFFSDNGGPQKGDPSVNGSINRPLRSGKAQAYEGGIRVPMLMSLPGVIPAGTTYDKPVISLDLLPTFMAAIGKAPIEGTPLDGVNLLPFVTGANTGRPHDRLYWRLGAAVALIEGDYKLVYPRREGGLEENPERVDLAKTELYDVAKDPRETTNLAATQPEKYEQMKTTWKAWESTLAKPLWGTWADRVKKQQAKQNAATQPATQPAAAPAEQ